MTHKCAAFCLVQAGSQPGEGWPPYRGGAGGSGQQLTSAECKCNLLAASGKSIFSWEPEDSLWGSWQYQPLCC